MIFTDTAEEEIARALDPDFFAKVSKRVNTELTYQLAKAVFNDHMNNSAELPPEQAFPVVNMARQWLETYLYKVASGYSPLRWLWMMRRLPPHIFSGPLPTTFGYDAALAETLTGLSEKPDSGLKIASDGKCYYSTFGATIRRLAEFCAAARYLSHLHATLRWIGKGSKVVLKRDAMPILISEEAIKDAVTLYDQRGATGRPFQRSGTILGTPASDKGPFVLCLHRMEPELLPLPREHIPDSISDKIGVDELLIRCKFFPSSVSFEPFTRLLKMTDQVKVWPREAMVLVLLLWGAWRMIFTHRAGMLSVLTRGYLFLDRELTHLLYHPIVTEYERFFGKLFSGSSKPESAEAFVSELSEIRGCTWPLRPGPIVRREGPLTCVDLLAATEHLDAVLAAPISDGVIPNVRAQHFELLTQELIDRSCWKPGFETAKLRGRTLRVGGAPITDIDAIGESGEELLAVSCKRTVYVRGVGPR